jgi:hypothetical protein
LIKALPDASLGDPAERILRKMPPQDVIEGLMEEVRSRDKGFFSYFSLSGKIESGMRTVISDLGRNKVLGALIDTVKLHHDTVKDAVKNIREPFAKKCISLLSAMPAEHLAVLIDDLETDPFFDFLRLSLMSAGEKMVPVILGSLAGKTEKTQDRCAVILADIGAPGVPHLLEAMGDESKRDTAQKALIIIGPPAVPMAAAALSETRIRETLLLILEAIGPAGFKGFSPSLADPEIGSLLEEVALSMREDIIPELINGLGDTTIRPKCTSLLKKTGTKAVHALVNALKKEELAPCIIEILAVIGPSALHPLFEKYRAESGAVASFFKSISSFGKKEASASPVKRALLEIAAQEPGPLKELSLSPKNRDLALPLLEEIARMRGGSLP